MMVQTSPVHIIRTIDRVTALLRSQFSDALKARVRDDPEIDDREWHFYPHLMWEDGWNVAMEMPGVFIHASARQLVEVDGQGVKPAGPDLMVGLCVRTHRDRLAAAVRTITYAVEAVCDVACEHGFRPYIRGPGIAYGRPESVDWSAYGTVVFGPVDGAPEDWL